MNYMRYLIMISLMVLSSANSYIVGATIMGDYSVFPGGVYEYTFVTPTGITTRGYNSATWKVTNGKIRDLNGNFTLLSLTQSSLSYGDKIYVKWDESVDNADGKIQIVSDIQIVAEINVYIQSGQVTISDMLYNSLHSQYSEGTYLTLKNVTIGSRADVTLNGFKSVRILPGFTTEPGCTVLICNNPDRYYSYPETRSIDELPRAVDRKDAELYNASEPMNKLVTLSCNVPKGSSNAQIYVYNSSGILMIKEQVDFIGKGHVYIDTSQWLKGIYLYSLVVDDCLIDTKRMVIAN